ncbi:MAG: hypothetical protein GQ574_24825 [Crocinitomix sp.]|nr:hypothetical protein [Crocinitomix sp.]
MKTTIIHPTDFSECADNALDYAILIAKALKLSITLVHSLDFSRIPKNEQNAEIMLEATKAIEMEAEEKLRQLGTKVKGHEIECNTEIFNGKVNLWLPDYIKEINPRFTVMGTTGSSNIANRIMGSNTFSIIKKINSPLLAVPLNAKTERFNKFVFSTDYKDADVNAITDIVEIAKHYEASVDIVHILNNETIKKVNNKKLLDDLQLKVHKMVNYSKLDFQLLLGENVHKRLQVLTNEVKPDFLALIMRKQNFFERLFFGSLTEKMAYHSETPIFIFPSESN